LLIDINQDMRKVFRRPTSPATNASKVLVARKGN